MPYIPSRTEYGRQRRPKGTVEPRQNQVTIRNPTTAGVPSGPPGPVVASGGYQPYTGFTNGPPASARVDRAPEERLPPPLPLPVYKPEQPSPDGAPKQATALSPENKPKTVYRVRGLPLQSTRETARSLLRRILDVDDVTIESLAQDASGRDEKVATVRFPEEYPLDLRADGDEWAIEMDSEESSSSRDHLFIDKHFDGFTPLCDPSTSEKDAVDFIAIHGLGGNALISWKDKNSSHLWIRDSLPRDVKNARILAYGYRARVVNSESFETIDDIAALFCELLRDIRSTVETRCRPLLFAAHSLGGLVLKAALGKLKHGSEDDRLSLRCTHGILCFGVPNQGMETSHMLAMIGGQQNVPLVLSLSRNPHALIPLNERFNYAFPFKDSTVVSFYETETSATMLQGPTGAPEMTGKRVVLVDWWSAQNGRTGMDEPRIPIKRDHSNMVKFSPRDEYYTVVKNRILSIADNALQVVAKRLDNTKSSPQHIESTSSEEERESQEVKEPREMNEPRGMKEPREVKDPQELKINGDSTILDALPIRKSKNHKTQQPSDFDTEDLSIYIKEIELLKRLSDAHVALSTKYERESALIWAVHEGELDMVNYILDRKTDPDTLSHPDAMTALSIAAKNGHETLVDLLISRGANVNALDLMSRSTLYIAAGHGRIAIMRRLIASGALMQQKILPGLKPTDVAITALMNAARFGQEDSVTFLIDNGAKLNAQSHLDKWTALHAAICSGEYETVEILLEQGADPNLSSFQGPPLIHSVLHSKGNSNRLEIARLLLEHGADPDTKDSRGFAALHYAVRRNDYLTCTLLLDYDADVNVTGALSQTPLHLSIGLNHQRVTRLLDRWGADSRRKDASGRAASPTRFDERTDVAYLPPRPNRHSSCLYLPLILRPMSELARPPHGHFHSYPPNHYHMQHRQDSIYTPREPGYRKVHLDPSPQYYQGPYPHVNDHPDWMNEPYEERSNLLEMPPSAAPRRYSNLRDDVTISEAEEDTISDTYSQGSSQVSSRSRGVSEEESTDDEKRRSERVYPPKPARPYFSNQTSDDWGRGGRDAYRKHDLHYQYVESDDSPVEDTRFRREAKAKRARNDYAREEYPYRRRTPTPPRGGRRRERENEVAIVEEIILPPRARRSETVRAEETERRSPMRLSAPPSRPEYVATPSAAKPVTEQPAASNTTNGTPPYIPTRLQEIKEEEASIKAQDFGIPSVGPPEELREDKNSVKKPPSAPAEITPSIEVEPPLPVSDVPPPPPHPPIPVLLDDNWDAWSSGWGASKKKKKTGTVSASNSWGFGTIEEKADRPVPDDDWDSWPTGSKKKGKKAKKSSLASETVVEKAADDGEDDIWGFFGSTGKKDKKKKKKKSVESDPVPTESVTQNGVNGITENLVEEPAKDEVKEAPILDRQIEDEVKPAAEIPEETIDDDLVD